MRIFLGLVLVLLCWTSHHAALGAPGRLDTPGQLTNEFAVIIDGDEDVANLVAGAYGFNKVRRVSFVGVLKAYISCWLRPYLDPVITAHCSK